MARHGNHVPSHPTPSRAVLLIGDFSGHAFRATPRAPLGERPIQAIDLDNFDEVFARIGPVLVPDHLGLPDTDDPIRLRSFSGFHPDSLVALEEFREGVDLLDPSCIDGPEDSDAGGTDGLPVENSGPAPGENDDDDTFERLLGRGAVESATDGPPMPDLSGLLKKIVAPHIVDAADQHAESAARIRQEISSRLLRDALAAPPFRTLESLWSSARGLVHEVQPESGIEFYLLDASRAELSADLESGDWRNSGLCRALRRKDRRWSLLVGDIAFGCEAPDVLLLASLGALAADVNAPFLAAAKPSLFGCRSAAELAEPDRWRALPEEHERNWQTIRKSDMAQWVGLILPRVLLRLPYGSATDPIDSFPFEELESSDDFENLLWGNPAFAGVHLIGRALAQQEDPARSCLDLDDLPGYIYSDEQGKQMHPCGETHLSLRAAEAILSRGVMSLVSYRDRNAVRLLRWQSLAASPSGLAAFPR